MAGIIQQGMGRMADKMGEQEPMEGAGPDGGMRHEGMEGESPEMGDNSVNEITSDSVRKQMELPKGLDKAYDKIIKAGLKVMFDPSMREETMGYIEDSGVDPAKMAEGVAAVVVTLFKESNETLPPNLIVPAGIELMVHAAEVAKSGGMDVPNEVLAEAMSEVVQQLLTKFGVSPESMQELMGGMASGQQAPAGAAQAPSGQPPMGQPAAGQPPAGQMPAPPMMTGA
jgi:hypothetical protein